MATNFFNEIQAERFRQDQQWGGPEHDDAHDKFDWFNYIVHQMNSTDGNFENNINRFVKIAALAVAAAESIERQNEVN